MHMVIYIALLLFVSPVTSQSCENIDVQLVIDQSEAARDSSARPGRPYGIIVDELGQFLNDNRIQTGNNISIGVVGFSGPSNVEVVIVPPTTDLSSAANNIISRTRLIDDTSVNPRRVSEGVLSEGLRRVDFAPRTQRNVLIVVSAGGSPDNSRIGEIQRQRGRLTGYSIPWNIHALVVTTNTVFNQNDFTALSPLSLTRVDNPSGNNYNNLAEQLLGIVTPLCSRQATQSPPLVPFSQVCSDCSNTVTLRRHEVYCDKFIMCVPNSSTGTPSVLTCGKGALFDSNTGSCDHIFGTTCEAGPCSSQADEGKTYPSGRCCNVYFQCQRAGGSYQLIEKTCSSQNEIVDASGTCVPSTGVATECQDRIVKTCGALVTRPSSGDCGQIPDEFGDPCTIYYRGLPKFISTKVSDGTRFDFENCVLTHDLNGVCASNQRVNFQGNVSSTCNANFLHRFNAENERVFSERLNQDLNSINIETNKVRFSNGAVVFDEASTNPYLYYFFFSRNYLRAPFALRIVYSLQNPVISQTYDLLSNSYCDDCSPPTIAFKVSRNSANQEIVIVNMQGRQSQTLYTTQAIIEPIPRDSYFVEVIVIFDVSRIYGEARVLDDNRARVTSLSPYEFTPVDKSADIELDMNSCGIVLGKGTDNQFRGFIDEFSYHMNCLNIGSVLNRP